MNVFRPQLGLWNIFPSGYCLTIKSKYPPFSRGTSAIGVYGRITYEGVPSFLVPDSYLVEMQLATGNPRWEVPEGNANRKIELL